MTEAEFFYNNYPTAKEKISLEICKAMVEKFNVIYIPNVFIALYVNVNDEYFNMIKNLPQLLEEDSFIKKCFINKGNNIHFMFCVGKGFKNILNCITNVANKENAKTISWYRDDMKELHIRRTLCLSRY